MKRFGAIFLLLLLAAFAYGLNAIFKLRFETGDIYPPYSSFRTDPLGAKALYESFDHLLSVERNFRPLLKLESGRDSALFVLGVQPRQLRLAEVEVKDLEDYVTTGGRLVLSFYPVFSQRELAPDLASRPGMPSGSPASTPPRQKRNSAPEEQEGGLLLSEKWKFGLHFTALEQNKENTYLPGSAAKPGDEELPERISCHSALTFNKLDPAWRIIYARTNDEAVLIERKFGSGSIVLAADSYWFSNEALLKERYPRLLAWLTGPVRLAIFDETHLGVQEHRGVASLARKYGFHGFVSGLIVLAGLFIWRYGFSLVPPYEQGVPDERGEFVTGRESAAGFTNLLRRNISPRALLKICLEEWNKSCRHRVPVQRLAKVQTIIDLQNALPERERDPVTTYCQISQALARSPIPIRNPKSVDAT